MWRKNNAMPYNFLQKMNNNKSKISPCTNVHWMYKIYSYINYIKGISNGCPMDVHLYIANVYPCMDVQWMTLLCPWTYGSKMDVKRTSIRCTVLLGHIFNFSTSIFLQQIGHIISM